MQDEEPESGMPSAALCVLGDAEGPSPGARWCLTRDMRGRRGRKAGGGGGTQSRGCEPGEKGKGRAGLAEGGGEQKISMGEAKRQTETSEPDRMVCIAAIGWQAR